MSLDFEKGDGLIPVIIQHDRTLQVLMLGYMNAEAYAKTQEEGVVTFYSRSKQRLWTKGETSSNTLRVVSMAPDCDRDALLVRAIPAGPTCHTGTISCFGEETSQGFLYALQQTIADRIADGGADSYTNRLFNKGVNKVAQKVGEEAVELVIEATGGTQERFLEEGADLLYHLLILLQSQGVVLEDLEAVLQGRRK